MTTHATRRGLFKRASHHARHEARHTRAARVFAHATTSLESTFNSPYPPYPILAHPGAWYRYTRELTPVINPPGIFVSNRPLSFMPEIEGLPNPNYIPTDATMIAVYHVEMQQGMDVAGAIPLTPGVAMRFTDMGGGEMAQGFRLFKGWWIHTFKGTLYSLQVFVWVGPDAGAEWSTAQPIVSSIHVPA